MNRPCVVTIAGSDSGGGAGIQADLRTINSFGAHSASVITAITAQNSRTVSAVLTLPDEIVEQQIDAVMSDLHPAVVKLGMLGNARMVSLVARKLREWKPEKVVLDPVMIASSGDTLLEENAIEALKEELIPISTLITPNWFEAGALINAQPRGLEDVQRIVISLQRLGARAVLVKGGHLKGVTVIDTLCSDGVYTQYSHPRIDDAEGHGTGCALASAIAASLALGKNLVEACQAATDYVHRALAGRYGTGGSKPVYLALE